MNLPACSTVVNSAPVIPTKPCAVCNLPTQAREEGEALCTGHVCRVLWRGDGAERVVVSVALRSTQ